MKKKAKVGRKAKRVMKEYGRGELRSSSGQKVTDEKQAFAIAMSEQRRASRKKKGRKANRSSGRSSSRR